MGSIHPRNALTSVKIKNVKPGRYCDGGGLYLMVDDSGAKRWVLPHTHSRANAMTSVSVACRLYHSPEAREKPFAFER